MVAPDQMSNADLDQDIVERECPAGAVVLAKIHNYLRRFVSYPCGHSPVAHALWIVHTFSMERWDSTPRLAFLSPEPGSGKTRALEVTETVVRNPILAVNVSPAYLFRKVGSDDGAPVILYDEIDTVFGPKAKENEETRALLNAGHRKGAVAGRCVMRGKTVETEELPAYAAVAVAGLGWLPDTILSRSVVIRMRRRRPEEEVEPYRARIHAAHGLLLRRQIETWIETWPREIDWPVLPPQIQDRDADVWEPLVAVADQAGGDWPRRARAAAIALVASARETELSLGVRLLADLRVVFGGRDQMTTVAILSSLNSLEEAPWGDLKGKPLDSRGLARRLREYDLKSKNIRVGRDAVQKGYDRADFADAWARYLPSPQNSATSATGRSDGGQSYDPAAENPVARGVAHNGSVAGRPLHVADGLDQKSPQNSAVAPVAPVAPSAGNGGRP